MNKRLKQLVTAILLFPVVAVTTNGQNVQSLKERVQQLEKELAAAKAELSDANDTIANSNDSGPQKIELGNWKIGGALRANYVIGDYASGSGPTRGSGGGDFGLETFRINADYTNGPWMGKFEYRWYSGYNMLHTGSLGYQSADDWTVKAGVTRVPFGPGAWGVSNSWFFDQHYYVGLADDMDLGVVYTKQFEKWTLDLGYFYSDEGNWNGASRDSARYSYDPVVWTYNGQKAGYGERNQVNFRAIGELSDSTDVGLSLQAGQLIGENADDGEAFAASVHMKNSFGNLGIKSQLTYYNFDVSANPTGDDELIPFGAFDYAWPIATEAIIPAIAINYYIQTDNIEWLDSVNMYVEYSSIMKTGATADGEDFNNSDLAVIGAAWARGGWYIYTDLAFSNGNYFVGLDDFTTQGANPNDSWQSRLNINFGYYF